MTDNDSYVVQCTEENFDDARYLVQVFCRILEIDNKNYCIKTCALDGMMKQKLDTMGAHFWQEHVRT